MIRERFKKSPAVRGEAKEELGESFKLLYVTFDQRSELGEVDRLVQHIGTAGIACTYVVKVSVRRDGDYRNVAKVFMSADRARRIEPSHDRHRHIHKDQIRRFKYRLFHGFVPIRGLDHVKAVDLEQYLHHLSQVGFVFDKKDFLIHLDLVRKRERRVSKNCIGITHLLTTQYVCPVTIVRNTGRIG